MSGEQKKTDSSDYYFDSYSHIGIHEEMLADTVRTQSYRRSMLQNKEVFKGKIVLDIGCGTGILSMFAAQAGAEHVYGVDCADIIDQAKIIVKENGFADKITLIKGKLEELEMPFKEVDIIISEWMGYFLVFENMLDSVLYARDKYLKKGGLMYPDKAYLYLVGIEDAQYKEERIHSWENVYGFDYSCIKELAYREPLVEVVDHEQVITEPSEILEMDIQTIKREELDFKTNFKMKVTQPNLCHAFVAYFDIGFTKGPNQIHFSTGPHAKETHWKQTIFYLREDLNVSRGETITGNIDVMRNKKNPREMDVDLKIDFNGKKSKSHKKYHYVIR